MYQSGTYLIYGIQGVCRVVGTEVQRVNRKKTEYLVLEPIEKTESRFYLPTQNPAAMAKLRPVLTREEMVEVLASREVHSDCWIPEENQRKQRYRDLISSGDRLSLLQMLSCLYRHREEQMAAGRKFHQCDDNFLRDAERLLCVEVALVMDLTGEEAREYLRQQLK